MLSLLMLSYACVENDPKIEDFPSEKVDFKYEVAGNEYKLDYLVGSVIQFTIRHLLKEIVFGNLEMELLYLMKKILSTNIQ